ncbi:hypothetical protein [Streptomyces violaceusniger]|uniref:hypothetical protein n=1 Tax=Streptomyces violaceusniger TaxID=68280 RepID=UPI001AD82944|nr:hypothetical protein [Streptomyces violaceusniger]
MIQHAEDVLAPAGHHPIAPSAGSRRLPGRRELQRIARLDQTSRTHVQQQHPAINHRQEIRDMPGLSVDMLEVQAEQLRQHLRRLEEVERDQQTGLLDRLETMSPPGRDHVLQSRVMPLSPPPGETVGRLRRQHWNVSHVPHWP